VSISHPYTQDGGPGQPTDAHASTNVGDETDTSPFEDESDREYISTGAYIRNMTTLIGYLKAGGR
jgi:hypothetical protein